MMKKQILSFLLLFYVGFIHAQQCIDAIIIKFNEPTATTDTLFCKILNEDETHYTIDNGYAISALTKNMVIEVLRCHRAMNTFEIYKYKGIDAVTYDDFAQRNSAGNYLRKAAFNAYIATGLAMVGGVSITLGLTVFDHSKSKNAWIIGGGVLTGTSLFFIIRGWNQLYKAGKILDLKGNSALYISHTAQGDLGLLLKF